MTVPTMVSYFPSAWQGLLKALFMRDWPLAAAETWLRQNQDSAYGDTLSWTVLIEALCTQEPVGNKRKLEFKPRLFHLAPSLQQHLVAFIHQHHQDLSVDTLQRFVTVLRSGVDDEMSAGWLRNYTSWLQWNCQRRCDTKRTDSITYSFSPENEGHFKALCNKLSTIERGRHKRIWQFGLYQKNKSPASNVHAASSPGVPLSPLPASLPVANHVDTPTKVTSPTQSPGSDQDSSCTTDKESVHIKRKCQQDAVILTQHSEKAVEEIDRRETETNVLDPDVQATVDKLKELWEAGTVDPLPTKELAIFTQFPTQTVVDVCRELAKSGLSEVAIVTACKHICGVSDQVSHEKALVFASTLLLPMVLGLNGTASRSLLSAVIMFAGPFAKPLIEAVLVPCASSDKLGSHQVDLLSHVLKSFSPAQQKDFLRKFLSEKWPWNESSSTFLLNILDMKVDMDGELLSMLVSSLKHSGIEQIKGLKFAKVLLQMITKYGKQLTAVHIGQLIEIVQQNESFLKKSTMAALGKLQKHQS